MFKRLLLAGGLLLGALGVRAEIDTGQTGPWVQRGSSATLTNRTAVIQNGNLNFTSTSTGLGFADGTVLKSTADISGSGGGSGDTVWTDSSGSTQATTTGRNLGIGTLTPGFILDLLSNKIGGINPTDYIHFASTRADQTVGFIFSASAPWTHTLFGSGSTADITCGLPGGSAASAQIFACVGNPGVLAYNWFSGAMYVKNPNAGPAGTRGEVGVNNSNPSAQFDIKSRSGPTERIFNVSSQATATDIFSILGNGNYVVNRATWALPSSNSAGVFTNDGSGNISWSAASSGGSNVAGATGTSSGFTGYISTAATVFLFNNGQFIGALQGGSSVYLRLNPSSVTLQGLFVSSLTWDSVATNNIVDGTIANADVASAAAINLSKLALSDNAAFTGFISFTSSVSVSSAGYFTTMSLGTSTQVSGTQVVVGTSAAGTSVMMRFLTSTTGNTNGDGQEFTLDANGFHSKMLEARYQSFWTSNVERLRINSGGTFGFGTINTIYGVEFASKTIFIGGTGAALTTTGTVTANAFVGAGGGITALTPANMSAGTLPTNVMASSVAASGLASDPVWRTNLGLAIGTNVEAWDADLDDLADGSLTGSKVGSGVPAANIAAGSLGASVVTSSHAAASVWMSALTPNPQISTGAVINTSTNPVSWNELKDVPAAFADGTDDGSGGSIVDSSNTFTAPNRFLRHTQFDSSATFKNGLATEGSGPGVISSTATEGIDFRVNGSTPVNVSTSGITMPVIATPGNPPTGSVRIYPKSDKNFYQLDATGTETNLASGGGTSISGGVVPYIWTEINASTAIFVSSTALTRITALVSPMQLLNFTTGNFQPTYNATTPYVFAANASLAYTFPGGASFTDIRWAVDGTTVSRNLAGLTDWSALLHVGTGQVVGLYATATATGPATFTAGHMRLFGVAASTWTRSYTVASSTADVLVTTDTVAFWRFDEGSATTAADSTGTFTGTLTGGVTWVTSGCKRNNCVRFDGIDDYIALANDSAGIIGDKTAYTYTGWFKSTMTGTGTMYGEGNTGTTTPRIKQAVSEDAAGDYSYQYHDDGVVDASTVTIALSLNDGNWHHVCAVQISKSSRTTYIDGVLRASQTTAAGTFTLNTANIGVFERTTKTNYFLGDLDEFRIYKRALTSTECSSLYTNGQ